MSGPRELEAAGSTPAIAVIFEVWIAAGCTDDYLTRAAALREDLERIDGFVSVERFESLAAPGRTDAQPR